MTLDPGQRWGCRLLPPQRAGKPGSERGSPDVGAWLSIARASRAPLSGSTSARTPGRTYPQGSEALGGAWKVGGAEGAPRGRMFSAHPSLFSDRGQDWGVYCFGPTALGWGLPTKCCYHLLVLSRNTGVWWNSLCPPPRPLPPRPLPPPPYPASSRYHLGAASRFSPSLRLSKTR